MLLSPLHFGEIIDEERLNLNFWIFLETKLQGDNTFLTVTFWEISDEERLNLNFFIFLRSQI